MRNVIRVTASLMTAIAILATTLTHASNPTDYSRMTVFGDSLVDVGNLPPMLFLTPEESPGLVIPPPSHYDRGRFSNGPNFADYIATEEEPTSSHPTQVSARVTAWFLPTVVQPPT